MRRSRGLPYLITAGHLQGAPFICFDAQIFSRAGPLLPMTSGLGSVVRRERGTASRRRRHHRRGGQPPVPHSGIARHSLLCSMPTEAVLIAYTLASAASLPPLSANALKTPLPSHMGASVPRCPASVPGGLHPHSSAFCDSPATAVPTFPGHMEGRKGQTD